jgi:hypothetical protein
MLGLPAETNTSAVIHAFNVEEEEAHHFAITGNFFEVMAVDYVLHLQGAKFYSIVGNTRGKGGILLELSSAEPGNSVQSISISGNQFHNMGPANTPSIMVESSLTIVAITGNQFGICPARQIHVTDAADGVHIVGNQFGSGSAGSGGTINEAILLESPNTNAHHFVHDNVSLTTGSLSFTSVVNSSSLSTSTDIDLANNKTW